MCLAARNSWVTSPCETDLHHSHLILTGLPFGSLDVPVICCCVTDHLQTEQLLKQYQSSSISHRFCGSGIWWAFGWEVWAQGFSWGSNQMVTMDGVQSLEQSCLFSHIWQYFTDPLFPPIYQGHFSISFQKKLVQVHSIWNIVRYQHSQNPLYLDVYTYTFAQCGRSSSQS